MVDWRRSRVAVAVAGVAFMWLAGASRAAEPLPSLPPPPAPPSSLETMAQQIVVALYDVRRAVEVGQPVATRPPEAIDGNPFAIAVRFDKPPDGARPDALNTHLADAIEAALRARRRPGPRVVAGTGEALERIEIELQVQLGHLAATVRRRALPRSVWEALLDAQGPIVGTGFSNVPIDLEVRTLLGLGRKDVRVGALKVVSVGKKSGGALTSSPILDLAIGDFDGDLQPDVAVLQADAVRFVHWARGGFSEELGVFSLRSIPVTAARVRTPMGRLVPVVRADGRTVLVVASSDRAEPVALTWGAAGPERLSALYQKGWPLYGTGVDRFLIGPWPSGTDVLDGGITEARFGTAGAQWLGSMTRVYDVRAVPNRDLAGANAPVVAAALVGGELAVTSGDSARASRFSDAGVVSVWVDFDADGELEAMTTSQALAGPDRVTLSSGAGKTPRWVGLTAQPVTAGAAGDVDRDGYAEVVLATWGGRDGDLLLVVPK